MGYEPGKQYRVLVVANADFQVIQSQGVNFDGRWPMGSNKVQYIGTDETTIVALDKGSVADHPLYDLTLANRQTGEESSDELR